MKELAEKEKLRLWRKANPRPIIRGVHLEHLIAADLLHFWGLTHVKISSRNGEFNAYLCGYQSHSFGRAKS